MTDIIKFNDTHTPKTAIGMKKFELAEALNTITDLQNPHQAKKYTPEQRDHLFNKSMIKVCDILDIDLDMHEMMKTGSEGFSYSDSAESTEELKYILDNKGVYSRETENEDQPQNTVKSLLEDLQDMTYKAHELSYGDPTIFGHLVSYEVDCIAELLGMTELSVTAEVKDNLPANTIKEQLQDIYSLNDSMITGDPNYIPTFDDGTSIRTQDLADMNMNALDLIAEMLGFELEEGATSWTRQEDKLASEMSDQEIYDSLPAEDKLNVDMLNKLREVRDHLLNNGQTYLGKNRITTATNLLECGFGVIDHEEE